MSGKKEQMEQVDQQTDSESRKQSMALISSALEALQRFEWKSFTDEDMVLYAKHVTECADVVVKGTLHTLPTCASPLRRQTQRSKPGRAAIEKHRQRCAQKQLRNNVEATESDENSPSEANTTACTTRRTIEPLPVVQSQREAWKEEQRKAREALDENREPTRRVAFFPEEMNEMA